MSQSAVIPEQMCLQQPFELSKSVAASSTGVVQPLSLKVLCERQTTHIAVSLERSRRVLASEMSQQSDTSMHCRIDTEKDRTEILSQNRRDVITAPHTSYKSHSCVLDRLYATHHPFQTRHGVVQ